MTISIHPVTTIEECRLLEPLQIEIWGFGELGAVPDHMLFTVAKEGGVVLMARTETGEVVGFCLGFLARTAAGGLKLASHQAGVLPAYQDQGIGYRLKLAQREAALERGLDLMTWTFDPLQGRNARFNLHKLGAVCNTYLPNLYGDMPDELNEGLPSDRFRVDWWLSSEHVTSRLAGSEAVLSLPQPAYPVLNPAIELGQGRFVPAETATVPTTPFCLVEIPADINRLKAESVAVALRWQEQLRQIFQAAFNSGYTTIDLVRQEGRNYYLLQKDCPLI